MSLNRTDVIALMVANMMRPGVDHKTAIEAARELYAVVESRQFPEFKIVPTGLGAEPVQAYWVTCDWQSIPHVRNNHGHNMECPNPVESRQPQVEVLSGRLTEVVLILESYQCIYDDESLEGQLLMSLRRDIEALKSKPSRAAEGEKREG